MIRALLGGVKRDYKNSNRGTRSRLQMRKGKTTPTIVTKDKSSLGRSQYKRGEKRGTSTEWEGYKGKVRETEGFSELLELGWVVRTRLPLVVWGGGGN